MQQGTIARQGTQTSLMPPSGSFVSRDHDQMSLLNETYKEKATSLAKGVEESLFGIIFVMVKDRKLYTWLEWFRMIVDSIPFHSEFVSFSFSPDFKWYLSWLSSVMSLFQIPAWLLGFSAFTIIFWIAVTVVITSILNVIYVGYFLSTGEVRNTWSIKTLRFLVSFTLTIFFIPLLLILL